MKNHFLILLFILFYSCSDDKSLNFIIYESSEAEKNIYQYQPFKLKGQNLGLTNDSILYSPRDIDVSGDTLLVTDSKGDYLILLFDLTNSQLLGSFNAKGYGPNEMMDAPFAQFLSKNRLNAYDITLSKVNTLEVSEKSIKITNQYKVPRMVYNVHAISDSVVLGLTYTGDSRLVRINRKSNEEIPIGDIPKIDNSNIPKHILGQAFDSKLHLSSDKSFAIISNRYSDQIEIFDLNNVEENPIIIKGPDFFNPVIKIANRGESTVLAQNDEMRFGYVDLYTAENYIYGLYSGNSRKEKPGVAHYGDKVLVFDFEGNFKALFILDRNVLRIAVDAKSHRLFASDFENKEHDIIQFEMPKF